ncbi:MAG: hypothetical protein H7A52_09600 [Akkermansiaceae bacterium]|nr:hypothetical protein [Akkermansiaceae bacterium]
MRYFLVQAIYNLLLPLVLLAGLPRFLIKGVQRGGLALNFGQRLGFYRAELREKLLARDDHHWIHAVSVGEVLVAVKIIRALRERSPDISIVLSTTTATGYRIACAEAGGDTIVIHNPVDLPFVVGRAIRLIRPVRLVLVEAEVWPNLVRRAHRAGALVILANARLSSRSECRFRRFCWFTEPVFRQLDRVCVTFDVDVPRWENLGVPRHRIVRTGSVKFDEDEAARPEEKIAELRDWLAGHGVTAERPLLLAAATHSGEEALIGRAYRELLTDFPALAYVAVPRHAERARSVAAQLAEAGLRPVFRVPVPGLDEEGGNTPGEGKDPPTCLVANTTGELRAWNHLASVVVIGKSLLGRGGQNPVEAVVAGRPVVTGPNMGNFDAIMASLVRNHGVFQLGSADELTESLRQLFAKPAEGEIAAKRGRAAIASHRGSAARTAEAILDTRRWESPQTEA